MTSKNYTFKDKTDQQEWFMTDKVDETTHQFSEVVKPKSRANKN